MQGRAGVMVALARTGLTTPAGAGRRWGEGLGRIARALSTRLRRSCRILKLAKPYQCEAS